MELENEKPNIYEKQTDRTFTDADEDENVVDPIDEREIFGEIFHVQGTEAVKSSIASPFPDLIRIINDPEHPLTLEELHVVQQNLITVDNDANAVNISFTPTIPHCSMATLIGLSIRVKLLRSLPPRFKVTVEVTPGAHASEHAVNKQLADKERIAAALENSHLIEVINQCIGAGAGR